MSSPQDLYIIVLAGDVVYYTIGDKEGLRCRTKASRLFLYACCALPQCVHNCNKISHLSEISPEKKTHTDWNVWTPVGHYTLHESCWTQSTVWGVGDFSLRKRQVLHILFCSRDAYWGQRWNFKTWLFRISHRLLAESDNIKLCIARWCLFPCHLSQKARTSLIPDTCGQFGYFQVQPYYQ